MKADFVSKIDIEDLIKYELNNYEAYYTGDYTRVIAIAHDYYQDLSIEEITQRVKKYKDEVDKVLSNYYEENIQI